jgi:hypothetical protein
MAPGDEARTAPAGNAIERACQREIEVERECVMNDAQLNVRERLAQGELNSLNEVREAMADLALKKLGLNLFKLVEARVDRWDVTEVDAAIKSAAARHNGGHLVAGVQKQARMGCQD